ncbi:ABC-type transport system, involved in lipoprotein release, permease component [Candidatus Methanoperedens nitroreducens]|uniref:ABC-type transport system, involved in lipoprotein release, permease component n=1 Tax=Candidatus Methanoperedens nitratireducens TaxID=1392998 RepID=A0A062UXS5_9EURY|nr:ABC transporter permease [Candidatus Methanoperedens nitroreducens]KCZ71781.1 ABC-type transport system, involved in lipoprotein release, permease component [Candidatus Methanoperedens nitroreducens]MDJ1422245.1 ABC transporter permease [Candidatus Methanoperedens sp.]
MKLIDAFEQVSLSFSSNKFKTLMSSLGIIIGVIAIVVMLSVGEGLQEGVGRAFVGLNLDVITIYPGGSSFEGGKFVYQKPAEFDDKDVHALENTVGVKIVSPRVSSGMSVNLRGEERSVSVIAVMPAKEPELSDSIDKGRFLMESDRSAIVIGSDIANKMFKMPLNPGMRMSIKNKNNDLSREFTIVGILKEKEQTSAFGGNSNMEIFTTHQALKDLLDVKNYSYSYILVTVEDQSQIENTAKRLEDPLRRLHKDEAFTIFMMKSILEQIGQLLTMIKFALGGIGAISLAVGGIGIVNVMMLTVTERIKEIGVMKAVGATRENIQMVFMLESGLLGLVSGLIGITMGAVISILISTLGAFPIAVTWTSLVIGLLFGVITTTIAGVYPASKAARLDPVEALRAE